MAVIIGMAALAIDVSQWYATRHQAQVAADSAALAGANCMANGGTTDSTSCGLIPASYVSDNGFSIQNVQYNVPSNGKITVTVTGTGSNHFASVFGIGKPSISATAVASWTGGQQQCTEGNGGANCAAVFAMGTSCTNGAPGSPISFSGSNDTITGSVHSNGSIYEGAGHPIYLGPTTFGNGSGCKITTGTGDQWNGSTTAPSPGETPINTWPIDYSQVLTACGGTGEVACTGPSGTPAYCTQAAANFTFGSGETTLATNNVWCAFGTGNPSDPSTYTGTITFQSTPTGTTTIYGTWIGGTINVAHGSYLSVQSSTPNYPLFYDGQYYNSATGACSQYQSGYGVVATASGDQLSGDIFEPCGTIEFNGAGSSFNFLEANAVYFDGGTQSFTGDGPSTGGGGTTPGTDNLIQ